ncbi:MAG: hypothetical protein GY854_33925 [Deltaproteobacteria bacterium]|nr:hypothetical protein [Deltaproteobacteria bacterium]
MKRTISIVGFFVAIVGCLLVFSPGCEEVLAVCAPCGSVLEGDVNTTGDPRLDGTLEAIQRIRRFAEGAVAAFDKDTVTLSDAFNMATGASVVEITNEIRQHFLNDPAMGVIISYEPARCWVDKELAVSKELACEERLGDECNLPRKPNQRIKDPSCTGLYVGDCNFRCLGRCFEETTEDSRSCPEECIGACADMEMRPCPGICYGNCSGICSAHSSSGECAGHCEDMCTGVCESPIPFTCNGSCNGLCRVDIGEGDLCRGECRGSCVDQNGKGVGEGICRGHLRPAGFDEDCGECREMAKGLAWSMLSCEPALVHVGVNFLSDFSGDRAVYLSRARILERVLLRVANDHARLALLVDGVDVAGELTPDDLDESKSAAHISETDYLKSSNEDYIAGLEVVMARRYFPLSNLKARVGMLIDTATQGDFKVSEASLSCVTPAFEEAKKLLFEMVPTVRTGGRVDMARPCAEPTGEEDTSCLYRIVDWQAVLLELAK